MSTGRVVQFDEARGYGFIAPDGGGEDVFVHVNMLGSDRWSLALGVPVEFQAVDSERGPKALSVRVVGSAAGEAAPAAGVSPGNGSPNNGGVSLEHRVAPATAAPAELAGPVPSTEDVAAAEPDDGLCDVLSERAFRVEITESLLNTVSDLTAAQVVALRQELLAIARRHGWVDVTTEASST